MRLGPFWWSLNGVQSRATCTAIGSPAAHFASVRKRLDGGSKKFSADHPRHASIGNVWGLLLLPIRLRYLLRQPQELLLRQHERACILRSRLQVARSRVANLGQIAQS